MSENKKIAIDVCKVLGGFFGRDNVYIGGSLALEIKFPVFGQTKESDIDIFILTRRMETWALDHILEENLRNIGIYILKRELDEMPDYRLRGQWKRYKAFHDLTEVDVDLIFIDGSIQDVMEDTASDLSKFYYHINYAPDDELPNFLLAKTPELTNVVKRILSGSCKINIPQANDNHIKKIEDKCNRFGLKTIKCNTPATVSSGLTNPSYERYEHYISSSLDFLGNRTA